jgi:hypothetical protein
MRPRIVLLAVSAGVAVLVVIMSALGAGGPRHPAGPASPAPAATLTPIATVTP